MIDVLLGLQWGDEGKGKVVDFLAASYDVIARFQGGPNAGHTLYVNGEKVVLHTIPSGIFHPHALNLIGNGVVLDPVTLRRELQTVLAFQPDAAKRLYISRRAHIITPTHRALDAASEASKGVEKIGSTLKGIGPAYMDKTGRNGLRAGDLHAADFDKKYSVLREKHLRILEQYNTDIDWTGWEQEFFNSLDTFRSLSLVNGEYFVNDQLAAGRRILAEGAQGSMLDIDFGTYPYVTSSNTIAAGACTGLGVAPSRIGEVIGITKAYCTRVGSGPFPTELEDATGDALRKAGSEFGATTGRPRRCGWLDLVALRYAVMLSGVTQLVVTKADVLDGFDPIRLADAYLVDGEPTNELPYDLCHTAATPVYRDFAGWDKPVAAYQDYADTPRGFQDFCHVVGLESGAPIAYISNGPGRDQIMEMRRPGI